MESKWAFVATLGAVFMLSPFAIDMYLPALPAIAVGLQSGIDAVETSVAVYLAGFALGQLVLGPLTDTYGRRKILICGLVVFTGASVLASTADTIGQLYLWRLAQGLGSAGSVAVFPMVRSRFGETEGAQVISYIMALTVVAPLVAPILGGHVLTSLGWEAIFLVLALLGAIALLASTVAIKPHTQAFRPLSVRNIVRGYAAAMSEPRIVAAIFSGGFAFAGLFAFVAGSPFVYISHFGVAPQNYGYLVGINAAAMISVNLINAQLLPNVAPASKLFVGAVLLFASGLIVLAVALLGLGLVFMVASVAVYIGALGLTATNAIVVALSVTPEENGTVAAVNGALQFAIGAISSLVVGVLASTNAVPMTFVMAGCAALAFFSALNLRNRNSKTGPAAV